jgi:obg-like ATPase 1
VDGIFHLCRAFDDDEIVHVEGDVNPVRDLEIIHEELRLKDEEFMNKLVETNRKDVARLGKGGNAADKEKKEIFEVMCKVQKWISEDKKDVRDGDWTGKEIEVINTWYLLTAKPVVYLVNLSEKDFCRKKNKWLPKLKAWVDENHPGDVMIPFSGIVESNLSQLQTAEEKSEYLKQLQTKYEVNSSITSVLPKIVVSGYSALSLQYCKFF